MFFLLLKISKQKEKIFSLSAEEPQITSFLKYPHQLVSAIKVF